MELTLQLLLKLISSFVGTLGFAIFMHAPKRAWLPASLIGGVAYALYFGAVTDVKAQTAALLSYLDPVVAILLSALLLGENLTLHGLIGAVLVLGAAFLSERQPEIQTTKTE